VTRGGEASRLPRHLGIDVDHRDPGPRRAYISATPRPMLSPSRSRHRSCLQVHAHNHQPLAEHGPTRPFHAPTSRTGTARRAPSCVHGILRGVGTVRLADGPGKGLEHLHVLVCWRGKNGPRAEPRGHGQLEGDIGYALKGRRMLSAPPEPSTSTRARGGSGLPP